MSILSILPTKAAKAKYPTLTGHTDAVDRYLSATRILEHAEADQLLVKEALAAPVREAYFRANAGLASPGKSVQLVGNQGTVLVSFGALWNPRVEAPPIPPEYVREQFTVTVKGDEIPPEKQEPFVKDLLALAERYGIGSAIKAKAQRVPVAAFAELRHRLLTPEANAALEEGGLGTRVSWKVQ